MKRKQKLFSLLITFFIISSLITSAEAVPSHAISYGDGKNTGTYMGSVYYGDTTVIPEAKIYRMTVDSTLLETTAVVRAYHDSDWAYFRSSYEGNNDQSVTVRLNQVSSNDSGFSVYVTRLIYRVGSPSSHNETCYKRVTDSWGNGRLLYTLREMHNAVTGWDQAHVWGLFTKGFSFCSSYTHNSGTDDSWNEYAMDSAYAGIPLLPISQLTFDNCTFTGIPSWLSGYMQNDTPSLNPCRQSFPDSPVRTLIT